MLGPLFRSKIKKAFIVQVHKINYFTHMEKERSYEWYKNGNFNGITFMTLSDLTETEKEQIKADLEAHDLTWPPEGTPKSG